MVGLLEVYSIKQIDTSIHALYMYVVRITKKGNVCREIPFNDTSKSTFPLRSIIISPQCIYETKDFDKNTQINTNIHPPHHIDIVYIT